MKLPLTGEDVFKITDCSKKPVFSNLKIPRFSRKGVPPSRKASEDKGKRCEVAKLAFCSEDVKTAAQPPCEVSPDGVWMC